MSSLTLKEEGNAFFAKGAYPKARDKYTEAIKVDGDNAVLWANRAACFLHLKKYEDALKDAQKTVELDPKSTKGWARLATAQQALGNVPASIESWEKAIVNIPAIMSPADEKHKARCEAGRDAARKAQTDFMRKTQSRHEVLAMRNTGANPWEIAATMIDELRRTQNSNSSAWLLQEAYESFQEGLECLDKAEQRTGPDGMKQAYGSPAGLAALSNGIMMDDRVFNISDPKFLEKYNRQVLFEIALTRAWTGGTAEEVMTAAPKRLKQEGWDAVRPALSVTVRGYLVRGFLAAGLTGNHFDGVKYKRVAVDILEWGARRWPNVSFLDKGSVFQKTFIRGAKCMLLESYMQACSRSVGTGDKEYSLEGLRDLAEEILDDAETDPPNPTDPPSPGFAQAFHIGPRGRAHSCIGFYYKTRGKHASRREDEIELYQQAAKHYHQASSFFPDDDELKLWFMNTSLDMLMRAGAPFRLTLPYVAQMRELAPAMQRLWANSSLQRGGRDIALKDSWEFEDEIRQEIAAGRMTLDESISRAYFDKVDGKT